MNLWGEMRKKINDINMMIAILGILEELKSGTTICYSIFDLLLWKEKVVLFYRICITFCLRVIIYWACNLIHSLL